MRQSDTGRSRLAAMSILIIYGTTEGQTRKIADRTAQQAFRCGHEVSLLDSAQLPPGLNFHLYQAFIIAASVHQQCHQETITNFVAAHHKLLNTKPSAFISVSLSAVLEHAKGDAERYVDTFVNATGWRPTRTLLLGGAFRATEYDYFQQQIVRLVTNPSGKANNELEGEFTDWSALEAFVDEFLVVAA